MNDKGEDLRKSEDKSMKTGSDFKKLESVAKFVLACTDKQFLLVLKRVVMWQLKQVSKGEPERNYEPKRNYWHETWNDPVEKRKKFRYIHNKLPNSIKKLLDRTL
jgi:hypothetical protein